MGGACYNPWTITTNNNDYIPYGYPEANLYDGNGMADWGYNAISNGGNQTNGGWRTPTYGEWSYLLFERNTSSGIRFAFATVNQVCGLLLLPDDWNPAYYALNNTNVANAGYSSNVLSSSVFASMEQHGVVFLPAAGYRFGSGVQQVGNSGHYWTSSSYSFEYAYHLPFHANAINPSVTDRCSGFSVRLVMDACNITCLPNPAVGGTVIGGGLFDQGSQCTVTAAPSAGYSFLNWTDNGEVVSTNPTFSFTVTDDRDLFANFISNGVVINQGLLPGTFAVSNDTYVSFSQGNLQYIGKANTPYWKFAEHQWDCLSGEHKQGSTSQTLNRDLFGWGTSGYNHGAVCFQPWSTSSDYHDYMIYGENTTQLNLFDQNGQADWGYNAISNGGNEQNSGWRTLTGDEWVYLFDTRSTSSGIRFAKAVVNDVNGMVLLPDNWSADYYSLKNTNSATASYGSNHITYEQWATLEEHGAVFLPAAGFRDGTNFNVANSPGFYWSSTRYGLKNAKILNFYAYGSNPNSASQTNFGRSVRLVRSIHSVSNDIELSFQAGWNWFSSFIQFDESSLGDLQGQIDALGTVALIKSQNTFVSNESGLWTGSLTSLDNTSTYMIRLDQGVTLTLSGSLVSPSEHAITLRPGWNWIGFYFDDPMSLEEFFSSITLEDSDIIKSQNVFSSYSTSSRWSGNLDTLEPKNGYLFKNNGNTDRVLVFP